MPHSLVSLVRPTHERPGPLPIDGHGPVWVSCSPPSDPLEFGTLCVQAAAVSDVPGSCGPEVILERDTTLGRNAIDYRITNPTDLPIRVQVEAGDASFFQAAGQIMPRMRYQGRVEEDDLVALRERVLGPGESINDRLLPAELGREAELWLAIYCEPVASCAATLDYVLVVDPLECQVKEDCSSGWQCDIPRGSCVECIRGQNDCASGQTCELGRCTPPRQSTCHQPGQGGGAPSLLAYLLLGLMWWGGWAKRRIRKTLAFSIILCMPSVLALGVFSEEASAQQGPQASFCVGAGSHLLTGALGEQTEAGVAFRLRQDVRWGFLGLGVSLEYANHLTTKSQDVPPFSNQLGVQTVSVGPRFWAPPLFGRALTFYGDVQYARVGLSSNSLLKLTGAGKENSHGYGGGGGARVQWNIVMWEVGAHYVHMVELPGDAIQLTVMAGISTL